MPLASDGAEEEEAAAICLSCHEEQKEQKKEKNLQTRGSEVREHERARKGTAEGRGERW
eukprot:m.145960 g.145960  ORF g.145960 m.145960 type:complete len:59 (+) comp20515_c1_seq3:1316-1492(+)